MELKFARLLALACCSAILLPSGCAGPTSTASKPTQPASAESDTSLSGLAWLVGSWVRASEESLSEEHWLAPRGGVMLGMSHEVVQGRMVFFEYLRIEAQPDGVFYLASPRGRQPPTAFKMTESAERRVVFENPTHDFPQRVEYWLADDDTLHARIEGDDNGRAWSSEWAWQRVPVVALE